jgi:hypothetical protein
MGATLVFETLNVKVVVIAVLATNVNVSLDAAAGQPTCNIMEVD